MTVRATNLRQFFDLKESAVLLEEAQGPVCFLAQLRPYRTWAVEYSDGRFRRSRVRVLQHRRGRSRRTSLVPTGDGWHEFEPRGSVGEKFCKRGL